MLKRKLEDGTVVGLSLESVQGGVLITLDNTSADSTAPKFQQSFMLNPVEVAEVIDGLNKHHFRIEAHDGRIIAFSAPLAWENKPTEIMIAESDCDWVRFPLRDCEVCFIRKALENMADSLLFVGTWSGEPEEL